MKKVKISEDEYERLKTYALIKEEHEREIINLTNQISAQVTDCNVGPWCDGCKHRGSADVYDATRYMTGHWTVVRDKKIQYCKKHLREVCPEFAG